MAELRKRGTKVGICFPVLCEIEAGIRLVSRPDEYRRNLQRVLRHVRIWPMVSQTAYLYGDVHLELTRRGRVLSQVDMMIASLARQMDLTVVTTDLDFAALPDIPTENWLSAP